MNDGAPAASEMSSLYRLLEAFVALREKNAREHRFFEKSVGDTRNVLQEKFNAFAGDTQKAFQSLRQEIHGEKRFAMSLLNELLDLAIEFDHILASRPRVNWYGDEADAVNRWYASLEVQGRRLEESLRRFGVFPYDAVVGSAYNPALHERVSSRRTEGMGPLLIAEQRERGWASQQPEFVLRRPKVVVSD